MESQSDPPAVHIAGKQPLAVTENLPEDYSVEQEDSNMPSKKAKKNTTPLRRNQPRKASNTLKENAIPKLDAAKAPEIQPSPIKTAVDPPPSGKKGQKQASVPEVETEVEPLNEEATTPTMNDTTSSSTVQFTASTRVTRRSARFTPANTSSSQPATQPDTQHTYKNTPSDAKYQFVYEKPAVNATNNKTQGKPSTIENSADLVVKESAKPNTPSSNLRTTVESPPSLRSASRNEAISAMNEAAAAAAPRLQAPPYCCSQAARTLGPGLTYPANSSNELILQRQAISLLGNELRDFEYPIPAATPELLAKSDFMIQVVKYVPAISAPVVAGTRIKFGTFPLTYGPNNNKRSWVVDETNAGIRGRFYVLNEVKKVGGVPVHRDDESVWAQVVEISRDDEGEKMLSGGWIRQEAGVVEFSCKIHKEEKWVGFYWKRRV